jgi:hypothetical protein
MATTQIFGPTHEQMALTIDRYRAIVEAMIYGKDLPQECFAELAMSEALVPWNDRNFRRVFVNRIDQIWADAREGKEAMIKWQGMLELAEKIGIKP